MLPRARFRLIVVAVLAGAVGLGALAIHRERKLLAALPPPPSTAGPRAPPPPPPPPPPSADELALLAPLAVGKTLGDYTVIDIQHVSDGVMHVVCTKEKAMVRLDIALADPKGSVPPAQVGRYAVYYNVLGAPPEEGDRLALKLAPVLWMNKDAPAPEGMTTFTPTGDATPTFHRSQLDAGEACPIPP